MRIIAGKWRGRKIDAPKGEGTRPTIDRVRESLMSVLSSARDGLEGAIVLDAFAGSGALGLECVSRGAATAHLFDCDRGAQRTIEANLRALSCDAREAVLRRTDVLAHPPVGARPAYDLVLLDPPYATEPAKVFAMLDALGSSDALAPGAIVSYEHDAKTDVSAAAAASALPWRAVTSKKYGKVLIDLFAFEPDCGVSGALDEPEGEAPSANPVSSCGASLGSSAPTADPTA